MNEGNYCCRFLLAANIILAMNRFVWYQIKVVAPKLETMELMPVSSNLDCFFSCAKKSVSSNVASAITHSSWNVHPRSGIVFRYVLSKTPASFDLIDERSERSIFFPGTTFSSSFSGFVTLSYDGSDVSQTCGCPPFSSLILFFPPALLWFTVMKMSTCNGLLMNRIHRMETFSLFN